MKQLQFFPKKKKSNPAYYVEPSTTQNEESVDLSEIQGQENAKRALTIAAAARHHMLLIGPPGVGKSMLAKAMTEILPELSLEEGIEVTKIWSAAGISNGGILKKPPFRAPHHTISPIALVGGGSDPKPGEISLAHKGILFLDELPEFPRASLEALRQPIETGVFRVARAKRGITFPAQFTLITAMNPCPCGYYGDPFRNCKCSAYEIIKYQKKISGPLLDRIDLQVKVGRVEMERWSESGKKRDGERGDGEKGAVSGSSQSRGAQKMIQRAKRMQYERFYKNKGSEKGSENVNLFQKNNGDMTAGEIRKWIILEKEAQSLLSTIEKGMYSTRSYYRTLKVARTIADLEGSTTVSVEHIAEAFSYRLKEI